MLKKVSAASKLRTRLGLRSGGSLIDIRELEEEEQHNQIEQEAPPSNTNMNNLDSGNASGSLSPTVSNSMTIVSTNLSPKDILGFVQHLPTYEGPSDNLETFIDSVEELLMLIRSVDQTPYGQMILRAIRNRVKGKAHEALDLCGTPLIWDEIKANLKRLYTSKKTEAILIREIQTLPSGLSINKLFFAIAKLRSQLVSLTNDSDRDAQNLAAKHALYSDICLNAFVVGLNGPLKTIIRSRNPESIEKAYEIAQIEQNFYYQNSDGQQNNRRRENSNDQQNYRNRENSVDRNRPYQRHQQNQRQSGSNSTRRNDTRQQPQNRQENHSSRTQNPFRNNSGSNSSSQQNNNTPSASCNINDGANFLQEASDNQSAS
ncbi:1-phosphatidylinositol 3-phosphate 5-kinase-like [Drosophila rhopaloa]|uniref:Gag protein n=1 Tax=Drosophila rhopaloa TaxID=1041015 RepID=A0ABM5J7D9_DRORH|nr:1-phosphatidylinositol 3-phosphate 5-kinase-like [Drosophila rhopaloa]